MCRNFAVAASQPTVHHHRRGDQCGGDHGGQEEHGALEADHREQETAEEETDAFEGVLRSGQYCHPLEQRGFRVLWHDQLDRALGTHLGQVLGDPGERLGGHDVGNDQPAFRGEPEHAEREDLDRESGEEGGLEAELGGDPAADEVGDDAEDLVEEEEGGNFEGAIAELVEVEQHQHPAGAVGQRVGPVGAGD